MKEAIKIIDNVYLVERFASLGGGLGLSNKLLYTASFVFEKSENGYFTCIKWKYNFQDSGINLVNGCQVSYEKLSNFI